MSLIPVNPKNLVITVNNRQIKQFGTGTPFQKSPSDPKRGLIIGMGGDEVVTISAGQKMQYTVAILQHSSDSKYLFNLYKSSKNPIVNFSYEILGTNEKGGSASTVMTSLGDINRGIMEPSDDIFIFEAKETVQEMGAISAATSDFTIQAGVSIVGSF